MIFKTKIEEEKKIPNMNSTASFNRRLPVTDKIKNY